MAEPSEDPIIRAQLETRAKQAFWKQFQAGIFELVQVAPQRWKCVDAVHYRAEKQMLQRHIEPFYWGGCITVFLFATFRISGSKWYSRYSHHFLGRAIAPQPQTQGGLGNTAPIANNGTSAHKQAPREWKSYLNQKAEQRREYHDEILDLPTDVLVSILCGLSTIALLSNPSELEKDVEGAPLLPGKSIIYETMCPNMIKAFEETFDKQIFKGEIDRGVLSFASMVRNCKTRDTYISSSQNDTKRPDVVPYPGLRAVGQ